MTNFLLTVTCPARRGIVAAMRRSSRKRQSPDRNAFKLLSRRHCLLGVESPSEGHASHFQREIRPRMTRPMVRKPCIWSLMCTSVTGTSLSSSLRA